MVIQTITVLGQEVYCELSTSVPIACRESFINDLIETIESSIEVEVYSGTEELFYEYDGMETDVNVKWEMINWKEIAGKLYRELKGCDGGDQYTLEILEEYEKRYTDTSNTE